MDKHVPHTITKDMLAIALQKLEALQVNESESADNELLKRRAEEVAELALQALAVCVKYVLASCGESTIEGLGTFVLHNGQIRFTPEKDFLNYALLKNQDEAAVQQALRDALIASLTLANSFAMMIDHVSPGQTISGPFELAPEEKLLSGIFGRTTHFRFDAAASQLVTAIARHLLSAGVQISADAFHAEAVSSEDIAYLPDDDTEVEVGKTYLGKVSRIADFGAFVEILPGRDGLLHISEVAEHRIKDIRDELKEGDQVLVKVLALEGNRIKLSRKAILKEQRERMVGKIENARENIGRED
jgi:predicted RNA-binding protein with RPS1 domain